MYIFMKPKGYTGKKLHDVRSFQRMVEIAAQCKEIDVEYRIDMLQPMETREQGEALCKHLQGACGEVLSITPAVWRYKLVWT